ncbi:MAG: tyrosine-type recombinase/integrase [Acutalibacteraceae bacterium]|nr:tyrosine-type recombinase/integrase [Acutalibacteraceae bacterium]
MTVAEAYDLFMQEQKFRGNSPYTLEYYKRALSMFISFCSPMLDIEDLDILLFKSYQFYLYENRNINKISVRTYARAVKVLYRYLYFENLIDIDINRLNLMKANKEVILPLSDNEVTILLNYFDNTKYISCRDKTICMLMLDCGLRLGEVVNLKLSDIDFYNHYLVINGKGSKQRVVPYGSALSKQFSKYFQFRNSVITESNSVFLTQKDTSITHNTIKMLFSRVKKNSSLHRVYPHLLRHTFATNFVYNGGNLEVLRVLMGHCNINITQIYIHLAAQMHMINDNYNSHLDNLLNDDKKRE